MASDGVRPQDRQRGIAPAYVRDDVTVVVHGDDTTRARLPQQLCSVPLTTSHLEHDRIEAVRRKQAIRRLVSPEPVVLLDDAGQGALARQREGSHERSPCHIRVPVSNVQGTGVVPTSKE